MNKRELNECLEWKDNDEDDSSRTIKFVYGA